MCARLTCSTAPRAVRRRWHRRRPVRAVLETVGPDAAPVITHPRPPRARSRAPEGLEELAAARGGHVLTLVGPSARFAAHDPFGATTLRRAVPDLDERVAVVCGPERLLRRAPDCAPLVCRPTASTSNGRGGERDVESGPTSVARARLLPALALTGVTGALIALLDHPSSTPDASRRCPPRSPHAPPCPSGDAGRGAAPGDRRPDDGAGGALGVVHRRTRRRSDGRNVDGDRFRWRRPSPPTERCATSKRSSTPTTTASRLSQPARLPVLHLRALESRA